MKKEIVGIVKNLIISILIISCLIFGLSLVFYDKISLNKVLPQLEEYYLTEEMQKEIEGSNIDETEEVIVKYHIDATDLKKYEKNNEYTKGKNHPFAITSEYTQDNQESTSNTSNGQSGFYGDDGTK